MSATDPIADLLTRLRNANARMMDSVEVPASRLKGEILAILKREDFIANYVLRKRRNEQYYKVFLHYTPDGEKAFQKLRRVSTPGRRVYVTRDRLPIVSGGLGVAIVSTSKGLLTSREAWAKGVGGEVICEIW
ncbi:MAG: 30S ribosomal protein S8 [bacterium]